MARANFKHGLALGGIGPDLPHPGVNRMWRVEIVKNVERNPIKVTLMEHVIDGSNFYTPLHYRRTTAEPTKVLGACEAILGDVADYETLTGDYK